MALITCENVSFAYEGSVAVNDVNFSVNAGDYLCVVGENGSGKSTLIRGILRLKQPASGRITPGDGLNACEIGYLPQQTELRKDFPASVSEVVLSGRLNRLGMLPFFSRTDKEAASENMRLLDVYNIRGKCYGELSGGQQRRVLLARALCAAQRLLLLDEPTAGLDPSASQDLYRHITEINNEKGITVIMVSHDIQNAANHASHILHLGNTQKFFGKTEEYMSSEFGAGFMRTACGEVQVD